MNWKSGIDRKIDSQRQHWTMEWKEGRLNRERPGNTFLNCMKDKEVGWCHRRLELQCNSRPV